MTAEGYLLRPVFLPALRRPTDRTAAPGTAPSGPSLPAGTLYADDGVTALYADDGTTVLEQ